MANALTWFEIPVADIDRAAEFYGKVLGESLFRLEMGGNPAAIFPGDQNVDISGALVQGDGYVPTDKGAIIYLNAGDDLQPALDRVVEAGGTALTPKISIGEDGNVAYFIDSEGNRMALHSTH